MKNTGLIAASFLLIVLSSAGNAATGTCPDAGKKHAIAVLKADFQHKLGSSFQSDAEKLGTRDPAITVIISESDITTDSGAYFIPFRASGPKTALDFFGLVDCKSDFVEYSVNE